jgi:ubiquinol-cytochrome c reductase iron-sulfur subunit
MSRFWRWLEIRLVRLGGPKRRRLALPAPERVVEPTPEASRAELVVAGLLMLAAGLAVTFIVLYAGAADTQLLGLSLGLSLAALAAALVVTAFRLVALDEAEEPYPEREHPAEVAEVEQLVGESAQHLTRRRLLGLTAGGAGLAVGAALLTPLASLGPVLDAGRLRRQPWRSGLRLVDSEGRPLRADAITPRTLHTAFPEGADPEELASPIVVVRLEPGQLDLPPERSDWAPDGIVAYSKICTHAGCAVSLYRAPLYAPAAPGPALVCPCHYSMFDPGAAGKVLFGPAGRALPQLPLALGSGGELQAAGGFSEPVGPSWWGVRR